jgi:hypothetical protein
MDGHGSRRHAAPFSRKTVLAKAKAIRAHDRFDHARSLYTQAALDTFEGRGRDAKLICQTARYVTMFMIIHLHATADRDDPASGASVTRIQELVAQGRFGSQSWVKLAVRSFHAAGLLDRVPSPDDRRRRLYAPSDRLIELGRSAMARMLRAVVAVHPLTTGPETLAARRDAVQRFASMTVDIFVHRRFTILDLHPEAASLLGRDFGHLVLMALIGTMRPLTDGGVGAQAPSAELAGRYAMSRTQARTILSDMQAKGWVRLEAPGGRDVTLSPAFAESCRMWVAGDLAFFALLADRMDDQPQAG